MFQSASGSAREQDSRVLSLKILSGNAAGRETSARRFPFSIGRSKNSGLVSSEPGVWEDHARLTLDPKDGFQILAQRDASVLVNGTPVSSAKIHNGDTVRCGGLEFTCWISAATQKRLGVLEGATWGLIAAVWIGQAIWLYQLVMSEL